MERPLVRAGALVASVCIAAVVACGEGSGVKAPAGNVQIVSPEGLEPGGEFRLRLVGAQSRSPTWILSRDGSRLFSLGAPERSAPPHYFPIGGSLDVSSVAIDSPVETLVWPEGLNAGTYELCNFHLDDLCVTITIGK